MPNNQSQIPWIFWPFKIFWDVLTGILNITGRLIACILGIIAVVIGLILTFTVVAAPIGIPLMIIGLLLLIRSIL